MDDLVSCGLDWVPIVGDVKCGLEFITGRDAVTNEKLNGFERMMCGVGLIPLAGKFVKNGSKLKKVCKLADHVDEVYSYYNTQSAISKARRENEDE